MRNRFNSKEYKLLPNLKDAPNVVQEKWREFIFKYRNKKNHKIYKKNHKIYIYITNYLPVGYC